MEDPKFQGDLGLTSLCLWREARGEGTEGMAAVACVLRNRVRRRHTSFSIEVMRPWQFTSMTDPKDPEYTLYPAAGDESWTAAQCIAEQAIAGELEDLTRGATLYWNPSGIESTHFFALADGRQVKFPMRWTMAAVREAAVIGKHIFLQEIPT